ncbi:MAG: sugar phosphate isomerase/epimerase family protein [Desulfatiglandaceae bacterium]
MNEFKKKVQVNIPFTMLWDTYLLQIVEEGLNPEIGLDATALENFTQNDFRSVAEKLRERGLVVTLHAPFMDLSSGSPDPDVWKLTRRRYEQLAELVPLFRPKTVVCHAGFEARRYGFLGEAWYENSLKMWSWLASRLDDEGSMLMLENVFEEYPEDLNPLFDKLDRKKVGFCLDVGHCSAFSAAPVESWIHCLGPYIGQLHLHDNLGQKDDHLCLGRGSIDFGRVFSLLVKILKGSPVVTLEPHREEDVRPTIAYLAKVWPW